MKETLTRKGSWLFIFLFVFFANMFLFHSLGALASALVMIGISVFEVAMFRAKDNEFFARLFLVITLILSITVLYVSSPEKHVLIALTFIGSMIVAGYSMLNSRWISGILELFLSTIIMGISYLGAGITLFIELVSGNFNNVFGISNKDSGKSGWIKSMLIGLALGLPLVIWLISTLSQADPVFASYTKGFFTQDFWNKFVPRAIFSLFITCVTAPLMFMRLSVYTSPLAYLRKVSWSKEVIVITSMVVLVLGAFLLIQWPYVFVSVARETDLSAFGVSTYSAYVQQGFWDLLKVAAMVFGVAWMGLLFGKNSNGITRRIYFGLQAILGVEFVIFIASIFRRVWLYQSYHGFSLARLYGLVVLIWIMGMVVTMIMRYMSTRIAWVRVEMAWLMVVVMSTILINLERLVVKDPPTVNGWVDYVYLSRLPGDGYEGWIKSYEWARQTQLTISSQSGVISRDSRRELYYAWLVAGNLASSYHRLIEQYGSDEELKDYYRQVIEAKRNTLEINLLSDAEKTKVAGLLDKVTVSLDGNNWDENVSVYPSYSHMMYKSQNNTIDTSLYLVSDAKGEGRQTTIDQVLGWSGADERTYQRMKKEVGVEGILGLQLQNMGLTKRIVEQPKGERDFDVDISFDSPFMR